MGPPIYNSYTSKRIHQTYNLAPVKVRIMTDHESDREKYARRLAMFRSMGFDTSKLEDMLEHDFERLKEMGFDHIREQLEMAERREAEDEARSEAAKARTQQPLRQQSRFGGLWI